MFIILDDGWRSGVRQALDRAAKRHVQPYIDRARAEQDADRFGGEVVEVWVTYQHDFAPDSVWQPWHAYEMKFHLGREAAVEWIQSQPEKVVGRVVEGTIREIHLMPVYEDNRRDEDYPLCEMFIIDRWPVEMSSTTGPGYSGAVLRSWDQYLRAAPVVVGERRRHFLDGKELPPIDEVPSSLVK